MIMKKVLLVLFTLLAITGASKAHELEPLHVDGRYLKNSKGDIVTLHGFWSVIRPDTPIGGIDWGGYDAAACLKYKKEALDKATHEAGESRKALKAVSSSQSSAFPSASQTAVVTKQKPCLRKPPLISS